MPEIFDLSGIEGIALVLEEVEGQPRLTLNHAVVVSDDDDQYDDDRVIRLVVFQAGRLLGLG